MTRADAGEEFAALLHAHRNIVFKVAAAHAWQADDRADLAQEIAAQLWSAWPQYDPSRPFTTWMYRVALNTAMSHARRRHLERRHFEPLDDSDVRAPCDDDDALLLAQVMAGLDAPSRALLLLHLEARSSEEIAEILGLSVTAVTTRLNRLRQRLRDRYATP
ncbi:sigma-70 family RNA polymerase sigma factor [Lysobacter sp. TY2-98]|uniref:RNA polymerase sigma factor n=1 Tax=Lysobacter sp. TY2-98 TaxID=2290922 RepID=UPI001F07C1CD|nr:sigma-70 family RNA polymerase sigma factor [Lysobacter sp. TY2-98]